MWDPYGPPPHLRFCSSLSLFCYILSSVLPPHVFPVVTYQRRGGVVCLLVGIWGRYSPFFLAECPNPWYWGLCFRSNSIPAISHLLPNSSSSPLEGNISFLWYGGTPPFPVAPKLLCTKSPKFCDLPSRNIVWPRIPCLKEKFLCDPPISPNLHKIGQLGPIVC